MRQTSRQSPRPSRATSRQLRDNEPHATPDEDLHEDRRRGDDRARRRPARAKGFSAGGNLRHRRRAQLADRRGAGDRPVRATDRRAAAHPERAVRPRGGSCDTGHQPGSPSRPDRRAAPRREARTAHRRAQRGGRAADELPAAGRRAGRGPAARRADGLPPSRTRGHHARPRRDRSARRSSPTSIACPTRCSSWHATRTTNVASPNRYGSPGADVAAVEGQATGSSDRPTTTTPTPRPRRPTPRGTIGVRRVANGTTGPASRRGRRRTASARTTATTGNPDAAPEILGGG